MQAEGVEITKRIPFSPPNLQVEGCCIRGENGIVTDTLVAYLVNAMDRQWHARPHSPKFIDGFDVCMTRVEAVNHELTKFSVAYTNHRVSQ